MEKQYLTQTEVEKVIAFNEDEVMREAVRKVLFEGILECGVVQAGIPLDQRNWAYNLGGLNDKAMDNEKLGALLKATSQGIAFMEDGFKRIEEFKSEEPEGSSSNPAE
jgi:hypothetical protein